jgi:hypothetical protein
MRILFGHQSVGANILGGMSKLQTPGSAIPAIVPLESIATEADASSSAIVHFRVGRNGDPVGKLAHFEQVVDAVSGRVDWVMCKFCYVDVHTRTSCEELWSAYAATSERLERLAVRQAHMTTPLRAVSSALGLFVRRVLGRRDAELANNAMRERFNERIRQNFSPLFDLAHLESLGASGCAATLPFERARVRALAGEFTNDGGHLNARGQQAVARQLLDFLQSLRMPGDAGPRPERR